MAGILAAVLTAALPTSPARADWTQPVDLSAAGPMGNPKVGIDATGDAVFVWGRGRENQIEARTRAADGTVSPVQLVSRGRAPAVAVNASGDAVVVWEQGDGANKRIVTRTRGADGTLGPKRVLSAAGQDAHNAIVAINSAGDAAFAWQRYDGSSWRLQARTSGADGTLGPVRTLSPTGQEMPVPSRTRVAVDSGGNALVVWVAYEGPSATTRIKSRPLEADGTLRATQTLSPSGAWGNYPEVGFDASGDAVVAWAGYDGSNGLIQTRTRGADGTLGPVQTVSPAGEDPSAGAIGSQIMDVDPAGRAVFTWLTGNSAADSVSVEARTRTADGTLGPVRTISAPISNSIAGPAVGMDSKGDAVLAWEDYPRYQRFPRIRARTLSGNGALGSVQVLNPTRASFTFQLSVGSSGDAAVSWIKRIWGDFPSAKAQAAFGP